MDRSPDKEAALDHTSRAPASQKQAEAQRPEGHKCQVTFREASGTLPEPFREFGYVDYENKPQTEHAWLHATHMTSEACGPTKAARMARG